MTVYNGPSMGAHLATWEARGYSGAGDVASLIDSEKGRPAVVAGSAVGVFYELDYVSRKFGDDLLYFAANDVGMYMPRLNHWVSLHGKNLPAWKAVRWLHAHEREDVWYHAYDLPDSADYHWHLLTPLFALSGYFAMQIAWIMGCTPIVLVGCPASAERRFFEWEPKLGYDKQGIQQQLTSEMLRLPEFKATVRSQSGWTREFFGAI